MTKPGKFIVVEGLEGAGKSTAIQIIKKVIERSGKTVVVTREPGGTLIGEKLRSIVKEPGTEKLEERSELLMMYAARVQLVEQVIKPALQQGLWVIADRFELSTYAYQGGGRRLDKSIIDNLSAICLGDFKPDLILFLNVSPRQGMERVRRRGSFDRIEQESIDFFERVYQAYHQVIKQLDNVRIIDASAPVNIVRKAITSQLEDFINHDICRTL
ncbi:dTMP kinase [Legionella dresdenensis]|uniref:Thymidylate kinase n=1 Tax=Legionella dresdenensis TaxID=450200 RepID=A0ABV8CB07_9GAMM